VLNTVQIKALYDANNLQRSREKTAGRIGHFQLDITSTLDTVWCGIDNHTCTIDLAGTSATTTSSFTCIGCSSSSPCVNSTGAVVSTLGRKCTVHDYTIDYSGSATTSVYIVPDPAPNSNYGEHGCYLEGMNSNGISYHGKFSNYFNYRQSGVICGVSHEGYESLSEYELEAGTHSAQTFAEDIAFSIGVCDSGMVPPPDALHFSCKPPTTSKYVCHRSGSGTAPGQCVVVPTGGVSLGDCVEVCT
jgi:hypothetical protein